MAENKVQFGLKNVYVHPFTDDGTQITYDTAIKYPGAVNLSLDAAGDKTDFYADNGIFWSGDNNQGFTGKLEMANMPYAISSIVLGDLRDDHGVIAQSLRQGKAVALTFEFDGDQKATRHILYNVTFARPSEAGATKSDKLDVQTKEFDITAALDPYLEIAKMKTDSETDAETYAAWHTTPYRASFTNPAPTPEA
ncbi:major tail protein [Weissella cibaria]|uniref:major tail protein n=1 Tax=Weissella cibaria TaxID=137591 RepID=UPI0013DB615C|nr:major tail protein [Weissella cibaria]